MSVENQPHTAALILVELERQKEITDVLSFLSLLGSLYSKSVLTHHLRFFNKIYFLNHLPLLQVFFQKVARKIQFRFLCVWSQLLYHLLHHHSKHIEYYLYTVKGEFLLHSSNP